MSARNDTTNEVDNPKARLANPNIPTAANMRWPAPPMAWRANTIDVASAPTAGAERNTPSAHGPASRMSRA